MRTKSVPYSFTGRLMPFVHGAGNLHRDRSNPWVLSFTLPGERLLHFELNRTNLCRCFLRPGLDAVTMSENVRRDEDVFYVPPSRTGETISAPR